MKTLTKMPATQFSGLDYDNVISDIYNLVKDNPEYNRNWDDFLSSSAGRTLIELFAYMVDQLSTRVDWNVNENFITTATQDKSVLKLLKLIDYRLTLPYSSAVPVKITLSKATNKEIVFTPAYTELSGIRNNIYTISANDKDGNSKNFEAIGYDSLNNKYLYKNKVAVNQGAVSQTSTFYVNFYEGTTKVDQFESATNDNPKFTLSNKSVINNSVTIYIKRTVNNVTTEIELLKVSNFLEDEAQDENTEIPYTTNVLEDESTQIEFAPEILMMNKEKLLPTGSTIYVFYRIGGGASGNIAIQSINFDRKIYTIDNEVIDANFLNEESGYGGTDKETIQHASLYGPLSLRSVNKAVTIEDYAAILARNSLVLKSVSYGCNNMPDNFYSKYGVYINPQEVWNFILLNKNYEGIPPSEFNKFKWMDSRLENRFNEKYTFNNSKFNNYSFYTSDPANELYVTYKAGTGKTFRNYVFITNNSDFKENIGTINESGDLVYNDYLTYKATKLETAKLFFDDIADNTDTTDNFIDSAIDTFGMINGNFVDYAEENTQALYYSTVSVQNSSSDSNNVYGFDISTKYNIGIDIDGRGMIIIPLNDDYTISDNKRIFLSNPSPLLKPLNNGYYNTLYEARYHKGIVEKINLAFANNTSIYGADARPTQLLGLSLEDTSQASAFADITTETSIPITINDTIYTVSYGGVDRTSQYYSDIATYINTDLSGSGFTCEILLLANGKRDIRFKSLIDNSISIEKTQGNPLDLLYYLYNDLTAVPLEASSGGDYSSVASVVTDTAGAKYLKITSPSTGIASSIQFKVSDFKNDLNDSTEFMDKLGISFIGDVSSKVYGKKTLTLITNNNLTSFGNFIYETNILGRDPFEERSLYLHYIGASQDTIVVGSSFENFYSTDPTNYRILNKAHYIYNTEIDTSTKNPILSECNLELAFTKTPIETNSITNAETDANKVYMFPYDFIKLKTIDLSIIDATTGSDYFTSNDVLKFSIDNKAEISISLGSIHTLLEFKTQLSVALENAYGAGSYYEYIEFDYDNPNILYIKNKERNPDGNIYFPQVADNNLFFQKIFGTPAENELKLVYWEEITNHPLGDQYVEITNHPYIDENYSPSGGFFDAIRFDSRIKDVSYPGTYRTPDFYYTFDTTDRVFVMNKVDGNLIPDTEFYIHFVHDKRYNEDGTTSETITEDEQIKYYIDKYKISSLENKILPANFISFDVQATIYCSLAYSVESIRYGLEEKVRNLLSIENMNFNEPVIKSKIFAEIQSYPGVLYSEISFLGTDFTDLSTNVENKIEVDFDTIAVLSEDVYNASGIKQHGLIFSYIQQKT